MTDQSNPAPVAQAPVPAPVVATAQGPVPAPVVATVSTVSKIIAFVKAHWRKVAAVLIAVGLVYLGHKL